MIKRLRRWLVGATPPTHRKPTENPQKRPRWLAEPMGVGMDGMGNDSSQLWLSPPPAGDAATAEGAIARQRRLWFLARLHPTAVAYHAACAIELVGDLAPSLLEEALLTTLGCGRDTAATLAVPCENHDTGNDGIYALRDFVRRPFALQHGPLVRWQLWQLTPTYHILALAAHRLAADEMALRQMMQAVAAAYTANRGTTEDTEDTEGESTNHTNEHEWGTTEDTPKPPLVKIRVDSWGESTNHTNEHEWGTTEYTPKPPLVKIRVDSWIVSAEYTEALAFWQRQSGDMLADESVTHLPTDWPRPPQRQLEGGEERRDWPASLTQALEQQAAAWGVEPEAVCLAAWRILLYRITHQPDTIIGWEVSAPTQPSRDWLPLRATIHPEQGAMEVVQATARQLAAGRRYTHLPLACLLDTLPLPREMSHHPLFQVTFGWREDPPPPVWEGLTAAWLEGPDGVSWGGSEFDLSLILRRRVVENREMTAHWVYNRALFAPATISRLAGHYETLLAGLLAQPACPVGRLPLLSAAERRQLLTEWNATQLDYPTHLGVHHLVEQQAAANPARPALRCGAATLTYLTLNQRANQLARHLHACGVRPGALVGVCLPRTADLVVALLAVLKAGAAYVPLDPAYPAERMAFMLEDSQAGVLLTYHTLRQRLPFTNARLVCLDQEQDALCTLSDAPLEGPAAMPVAAASHVIYTSGSTGRPKGVVITHGGVGALIAWAQTVYTPAELAVVLASTSVCFDLSVFEIFVTLSAGGTVVLVDNILDLLQPGVADDVTLINTVPSAMAEVVRAGRIPPSVRVVNLAGEPFHQTLVQQLAALGVARVFNLYGPTEDTTYSTYAELDPAAPAAPKGFGNSWGLTRPPIGRPLANTQVYVLDEQLEPTPIGVTGEIYLAGAGLAQGYWRRPDLTAERFVWLWPPSAGHQPLTPKPPAVRLYRTGDLGRWRADGQLEFLGRRDHQVKLRGYRIELGEIEAALEQHPQVQEAVVVVWPDTPSEQPHAADQRLIAYVAAGWPPTVAATELLAFLARSLPTYLLPASITFVPALPRTPNGKIDRQRLPVAQGAAAAGERGPLPRNPLEEKLADIWREVLGVNEVAMTDDFFDLGGNSLLAVRLMVRIEQELGQKLPLSLLFTGAA